MNALRCLTFALLAIAATETARAQSAMSPEDTGSSDAVKISILLADVDRATGPQREELLQKVTELARSRVARLGRAMNAPKSNTEEKDDATVEWFEARIELADILGAYRARPVIAQLMLTIESDEERNKLARWMAESVRELDLAETDLTKRLKQAEANAREQVDLAPRLDQVVQELRWRRAFAVYDLARSTTFALERRRLFDLAVAQVDQLISVDKGGPNQSKLQLLKARCLREKGQVQDAVNVLSGLVRNSKSNEPPDDVLFELALARIDAGSAEAEKAITDHQALSPAANPKPLIEVRTVMLCDRLCRRQAAAGPDARKQAVARLDAAVRNFLARNSAPAVREPIAELFFKYWSANDGRDAPAPVLVMIATHHLYQTDALLADKRLAELPDAERQTPRQHWQNAVLLAERAKAEDADQASPVAPEALWVAGSAHARLGDGARAAESYRVLSSQYAAHPYAKPAALLRARICGDALDAAVSARRTPLRDLRLQFADALSVLLKNWGDDKAADEWRMALALQYAALADEADSDAEFKQSCQEAMKSCDAVGQGSPLRLQAQVLSFEEQYKLARRIPPAATETGDLVGRLQEFSATLRKRAKSSPGDAEKKSLAEWGCRCEFRALVLRDIALKDEKVQGLLSTLRERWPDCSTVREADEYLFAGALANLPFARTAEMLADYEQRYGKVPAAELAEPFLRKVRSTLEYGGVASDPKVKALYSQWAEWLYTSRQMARQATLRRFRCALLFSMVVSALRTCGSEIGPFETVLDG